MSVGILVASFGTSYEETRRKCIESIENLVKQKYGEEVFERAFTSNMIRKNHLALRAPDPHRDHACRINQLLRRIYRCASNHLLSLRSIMIDLFKGTFF